MKDGEIARVFADRVEIMDREGQPRQAQVERITWDADAAEKGGYTHFMLKEIHEQPRAIRETIAGRISEIDGDVRLKLGMSDEEIKGLERVTVIACGTSYHAGMLAKNLFARVAGLPVDVEVASEFLNLQVRPRTLLLGITQSGETADTLLALKKAKTCGGRSLAITNVVGSTVTELVDGTIYTRCGPEIGVAATKTFTSQLVAIILLAIRLGRARAHLTPDQARKMLIELTKLPGLVQRVLEKREEIRKIAELYAGASCYFFIGRDYLYPISLGRRFEDEGDRLHPIRGLRRRRAQARAAGIDYGKDARSGAGHLRQKDSVQYKRGQSTRGRSDSPGHGRRSGYRQGGQPCD